MAKKRSLKKPPTSTRRAPPTKALWCRPLQISEKQAADISIAAERQAMSPQDFIVHASQQCNDAFLIIRMALPPRSRPPVDYDRDGDPDAS